MTMLNAIDIQSEQEQLESLTVNELREKFAAIFEYRSNSRNRQFLIRKIIWGIQAQNNHSPDISNEAKSYALQIADEKDLLATPELPQLNIPLKSPERAKPKTDERLPMPGTLLSRTYQGKVHKVMVEKDGFTYEGKLYRSLSKVARAITGTNWNGFRFFNLKK